MIAKDLISGLRTKLSGFTPDAGADDQTAIREIGTISSTSGGEAGTENINSLLDALQQAATKSVLFPAILTKLLQTANKQQAEDIVAGLLIPGNSSLLEPATIALAQTLSSATPNLEVLVPLLAAQPQALKNNIAQALITTFTSAEKAPLETLFTELVKNENAALLAEVPAALVTTFGESNNLNKLVPALATQAVGLKTPIKEALTTTFTSAKKTPLEALFTELAKDTNKDLLAEVRAALVAALGQSTNLDELVPALATKRTVLETPIKEALNTIFTSADTDQLTTLFTELVKDTNNALRPEVKTALATAFTTAVTEQLTRLFAELAKPENSGLSTVLKDALADALVTGNNLEQLVPALLTQNEKLENSIKASLTKIFDTAAVTEESLDKLFTELGKDGNRRLYPTLEKSLEASFLSVESGADEETRLLHVLADPQHRALHPTLKKALVLTFNNSSTNLNIDDFCAAVAANSVALGDTLAQALSETFQENNVDHIAHLFNGMMTKKNELKEVVQTTVTEIFQKISAEQIKKLADLLILKEPVLTDHKADYQAILQQALNHSFDDAATERVVAVAVALSDQQHDALRHAALSHLFSLTKDPQWFADLVNLCRVGHAIQLKIPLSKNFKKDTVEQNILLATALDGHATLRSDALSLAFENSTADIPEVINTLKTVEGLCQSALTTFLKNTKNTGNITPLINGLKSDHRDLLIAVAAEVFKSDAASNIPELLKILKEEDHLGILKAVVIADLASAIDATRINFWKIKLSNNNEDKNLLKAALLQLIDSKPEAVKIDSWMATLDPAESKDLAATVLKNSKESSTIQLIIDALQAANCSLKGVLSQVIQDLKTSKLQVKLLAKVVAKHPLTSAILQGVLSKLFNENPSNANLAILIECLEKEGYQGLCQEILGNIFMEGPAAKTALLLAHPQRLPAALEAMFTTAEPATIKQLFTALDDRPSLRRELLINALKTDNPAAITRLFSALDSDLPLRQEALSTALQTADPTTIERLFTALQTDPDPLQAAAGEALYQLLILEKSAAFEQLMTAPEPQTISPVSTPLLAALRNLLGYLSQQKEAALLQRIINQLPPFPTVNQLLVDVACTLAQDPNNDPQIIQLLATLKNPALLSEVTSGLLFQLANQPDGEERLTQLMAGVQGSTLLGPELQRDPASIIEPLHNVLQYQLTETAKQEQGEAAAARLITALASSEAGKAQLGSLLQSELCKAPVADFVRSRTTLSPPAAPGA